MTRLNQLAPHTTMAARHRARPAAHRPAGEARKRLSFDAVLASYIRELAAADHAAPRPTAGNRTGASGA